MGLAVVAGQRLAGPGRRQAGQGRERGARGHPVREQKKAGAPGHLGRERAQFQGSLATQHAGRHQGRHRRPHAAQLDVADAAPVEPVAAHQAHHRARPARAPQVLVEPGHDRLARPGRGPRQPQQVLPRLRGHVGRLGAVAEHVDHRQEVIVARLAVHHQVAARALAARRLAERRDLPAHAPAPTLTAGTPARWSCPWGRSGCRTSTPAA